MPDNIIDELFSKDPLQEQLELYEAQLKQYDKKMGRLEGVDTPEAAEERERLAISIYDAQISIEQVKQRIQEQEEGHTDEGHGIDLFED